MPVKNRIAEMRDEVAEWRRDLHEHPELMYDTHPHGQCGRRQTARVWL